MTDVTQQLAEIAEKICAKLEHPTASVTYLDQEELRAALTAYEASRAAPDDVERVAQALAAHWSARVKEPDWPGDLYEHEFDGLARAALSAIPAPAQEPRS